MSTHHIILADRVANVSAGLREGADAGFHMTPSTRRQWANKLDHIAAELRSRQPADAEGRDVADAIRAARTEAIWRMRDRIEAETLGHGHAGATGGDRGMD